VHARAAEAGVNILILVPMEESAASSTLGLPGR
jgi:hypothetical protein